MNSIITKLESLIIESDILLEKQTLTLNEFNIHRSNCDLIYKILINMEISSSITDIAERGLKFRITKLTNPLYQWIYYLLHSRDVITYNAPYLIKHTDSDYFKRYVFWTKQKLNGLVYNLTSNDSSF